MVRDDHLHPLLNGFGDGGRSDCQASENSGRRPIGGTNQQTDVVPIFGKRRRSKTLQAGNDISDGGHATGPGTQRKETLKATQGNDIAW